MDSETPFKSSPVQGGKCQRTRKQGTIIAPSSKGKDITFSVLR